jgi:hypothetical protein
MHWRLCQESRFDNRTPDRALRPLATITKIKFSS